MGRRFGTVPGWGRAPGFDIKNDRIYEGTSDIIVQSPPGIPEEKKHIYEVTFDVKFFFYDSPPDIPVVTRIIKGQIIIQTFDHEYPGGLDKWVNDITKEYANEIWEDSHRELAGLTSSGGEDFIIEITDKKYTPPKPKVPQYVLDQIKGFERQIENLENKSVKFPDKAGEYSIAIENLKDAISKLKQQYGIE
jgi:hypothetical protein